MAMKDDTPLKMTDGYAILGIRSRRRLTSFSWWNGESFGAAYFCKVYKTLKDAEDATCEVGEYCDPVKGIEKDGVYFIPRPRPYSVEIVKAPDEIDRRKVEAEKEGS